MQRKRVDIIVTVDLDPIPGGFHTKEQAGDAILNILESHISHYHPDVTII